MARKARKQKKPTSKPKSKIDTGKIGRQLQDVLGKLKGLGTVGPEDATEEHVVVARDIAIELQDMNRGFKEALKRAMMADGKIKPGQTITSGARLVSLKPRPGCQEGSLNPDDYDLVAEPIS